MFFNYVLLSVSTIMNFGFETANSIGTYPEILARPVSIGDTLFILAVGPPYCIAKSL